MKRTFIFAAVLAACLGAAARPVSPERAREVALHYFNNVVNVTPAGWDELYVFAPVEGTGFVVVAADDCSRPVLAYSLQAGFDPDRMPEHVQTWFDGYRRELAEVRALNVGQSPKVAQAWDAVGVKGTGNSVPQLLTTTWDQSPHYNAMCPVQNSEHAVTGCVATAQAQIMKYWNHPAKGHGDKGYKPDGFAYTYVDFETGYDWENMPDALGWYSTQEQIDAVAKLMLHIGVAVEMQYGVGSSGAQVFEWDELGWPSSEKSLRENFRYSSLLHAIFKNNVTDTYWDSVLRFEIDHERPVLYTGYDNSGGHAFVLDGYDENGMFHVNWGWGGWYDGYYTTDSLSPGAGGTGGNSTYTFNLNNGAIVGIQPSYGSDTVAVIAAVSADEKLGTVSGNGTYTPYTTNVDVLATAAEGFRFDRWASDYNANPVHLFVNGDYTDTAIFVPLGRDTLSYNVEALYNSWQDDYGSATEWGIRIPALRRNSGRSLGLVQLYVTHPGYYTMSVYLGGDEPDLDNRLVNKQYNLTSANGWATIELDEPLAVPDTAVLWITFRHSGSNSYPAAFSTYCGVPDGSWYHLPDGWVRYCDQGHYQTWMIRALFVERGNMVDLRCNPYIKPAAVTGGGDYATGSECTLAYTPQDGVDNFLYWDFGHGVHVEDNPYTFTVTQDTVVTATGSNVGIAEVDGGAMRVNVEGRTITVEADTDVDLIAADGRVLGRGRCFQAPSAGVYLLRAGSAARRVVVK